MKIAIISLGSESSKMTATALTKYFDQVDHLNLKNIEINLGKNPQVLHNGTPITGYDCVYAKGSFRFVQMLRAITTAMNDEAYIPYKPWSYTIGHDKFLTHLQMQKNNVPMPNTYFASTESNTKEILEKISYPVVLKLPSGTQGKGVMFADSFSSASSMLDALSSLKVPFLIQEYVECNETDIRAFVVGNEVVACMKRKAEKGEKRANIHAGGIGEHYELDNYSKKIAIKAAESIGAEICGVDILESVKGPVVIEVNVSPGLQGITDVTKVDVADKIAKYLADKTKEFMTTKKKEGVENVMDDLGVDKVEVKK